MTESPERLQALACQRVRGQRERLAFSEGVEIGVQSLLNSQDQAHLVRVLSLQDLVSDGLGCAILSPVHHETSIPAVAGADVVLQLLHPH